MKNKIIISGIVLITVHLCFAGSIFSPTPFQNWNENSKRINRVNLWPIFYYQNPNMSALWPMIDKRNDGHAFRPLYSVYNNGDELNILWPLSSFDFKHHEYRVANVYYDKPEELYIFPISYFNFYEKTYWFLNTFISKDSFVFFPMYFYEKDDFWLAMLIAGKGKDWYSVMPPIWISSFNRTNEKFYFFAPLGMYNYKGDDTYKFSALFKLIDYKREKERKEISVLYLNDYIKSEHYKKINFFYISQYLKTDKKKTFYFFPIAYFHSSPAKSRGMIFPLFYKSKNDKENLLITPLFGMLTGARAKRIITPIISFNKNEEQKFINILALGYNHIWNDKKEYSRTDVVWPIFNYTREKEKKRVSIFPILDYKKSEKKYRIITPIISYGRSYKNENKFFNIGGIVFHYNKTKNATRGLFLWPLYEYDFNRNGSSSHSFILTLFERKKRIKKLDYHNGAISGDETITQRMARAFIFKNFRLGEKIKKNYLPAPEELLNTNGVISKEKIKLHPNIWKKYAKENWWRQKYITLKFPLIFSYQWYEKENTHFDILYWLYESDWHAREKYRSESSRKRILWWLMDYNRKGEDVSLDIFPFITYDKNKKEEITQFSFLWRFFRWRKAKQRSEMDILFIPVKR